MRRLILVPLAVAVLASGCSAVPGSDVVATVDDAELSRGDLESIVDVLRPDAPEGDAQTARDTIGFWILIEALRLQFATDGIEVTDADRAAVESQLRDPAVFPGFDELDTDLQIRFVDWQSTLDAVAEQGQAYIDTALANAAAEVQPRFGTLAPDGTVTPLALPTTGPTS